MGCNLQETLLVDLGGLHFRFPRSEAAPEGGEKVECKGALLRHR